METEKSKEFSEKLECLFDELDVENLDEAQEKLDHLRSDDGLDDLTEIAWLLNAMAEWIHFRVDSCEVSNLWQENMSRIRVYTYVWEDKRYELCLEDDYTWYDWWIEQMVEDVVALEKEANELVLSIKE